MSRKVAAMTSVRIDRIRRWFYRNLMVALIAFVLQGLWEYAVCGTFYAVHDIDNMTLLMIEATIGDIGITLLIFNVMLLVSKSVDHRMTGKDAVLIGFYGISMAFYFESRALMINRWAYSSQMLLLGGTEIGLLPILQLVILIPLTIFLEERLRLNRVLSISM